MIVADVAIAIRGLDYMTMFQVLARILLIFLSGSLIISCTTIEMKTLPPATYRTSMPAYIIASGDNLEIFVWDSPQLVSTQVLVRPDGKITIPLAEDVQASGKTPNELARELENRLTRYIKNPVVSVKVNSFVGRYSEQVRIIGQAAKPQSLPYTENMTLLDVLIAVGGLTKFADGNRATIVRAVSGQQNIFRVRLDDLINYGDISANVDMLPGDVLIIPEAWF